MDPPKTPKLEDQIPDDEISLSRSELYARLKVEKRHVANLEETTAALLKENHDLKASNAELSQKIEIIKEGISEAVSKAIGDIASGVTSLKAMAYDVGKSCDGKRRSRDCNPDATFLFDIIHDCTRKIPPVTPMNTPVVMVPPAMRAPVHGSESIRRAHAKVLIETSPHAKAIDVPIPVPEPVKTVTQQSIIDVAKESPVEEERSVVVHQVPADVVEEGAKTPVRTDRQAKPLQRATVHPIAMKGVRSTSVENINKRRITVAPETTAPPKMTRMDTGVTSRPTVRGGAIPRKPVAAVTGEGNSRDKMDPALASSTVNLTRRVGQHTSSSMAKADASKKTAPKRVVRGARGSEI